MFKKNSGQLTIGEHLIYQNLPEDILSRINKLIDWKPLERSLQNYLIFNTSHAKSSKN